jgi:hypothetical protein
MLEAYRQLTKNALDWEEYQALSKQVQEFMEIRHDIGAQLTTIILRRVVPGKCIYCPF